MCARLLGILILFIGRFALADQIIVGTPGEVAAGMIGHSVGEAANALLMSRQASIRRQSTIADLRSRVAECGSCAERSKLQQALQEETNAEEARLRQVDQMISDPKMAQLFMLVNDPLGIMASANRRIEQQYQKARDDQNLVAIYCYAITDTQPDEQSCTLQIHEQDFINSEQLVLSKCGAEAPPLSCVKSYSLTAVMQTAAARRCGINIKDLARPNAEVFSLCHHPTRPHPEQMLTPTITVVGILDGGSMDSLRHSIGLGVNYDRLFINWMMPNRYQTIHCYYRYAGETTSQAETFWYSAAPPGVSEVRSFVQHRLPPNQTGLGLLNLGGVAISVCPATYDEARALKQKILGTAVPTNNADITPIQRDNLRAVNVRDFMGRASLDSELQRPFRDVQQTNAPLMLCTYAPFEITKAAEYWYWSGTLPEAWPPLRELIIKAYSGHPNWPQPTIPLGTMVLHSCPATLADAERMRSTFDQPEPAILE